MRVKPLRVRGMSVSPYGLGSIDAVSVESRATTPHRAMRGPLADQNTNTLSCNDLHHFAARPITALHPAFRMIPCTVQDRATEGFGGLVPEA